MKQPRTMQTITNGRRMPLDADVIIFSVKQKERETGVGRGSDEKLIISIIWDYQVMHLKMYFITKSMAFSFLV